MKKYIVEGFGTFVLALVVGLSIERGFPVSTAVLGAVALGLMVYTIGPISGSHINPAVTLGAWSVGKIKGSEAVSYIIAQFVGAVVATFFVNWLTGPGSGLVVNSSLGVGWAEFLGTLVFVFGIASVVYGKTPHDASGLVIGGSLLLGIAVSGLMGSNGILNPAVAFSLKSFGSMYVLGPIIGSVLAMQAYRWLER